MASGSSTSAQAHEPSLGTPTDPDVATSRDVHATLNYHLSLDDEPPYRYARGDPPPGKPKSNVSLVPMPVVVHDARGREDEFTLDKTGFQFVTWPCKEKRFDDDERIKAQHYPEVEELLKRVTGAKRVFAFSHLVRHTGISELNDTGQTHVKIRGPIEGVHVDQTYEATLKRIRNHLRDETDRVCQSRVRLINVWRPIHRSVAQKPLAVMDWRTLDEARDLVSVRMIMPHREGSTCSVRYHRDHRWYYLSDQTPDEVVLIKCYDSETDGRARVCAHTAFSDPASPQDAPPRLSIEVGALVFDAD